MHEHTASPSPITPKEPNRKREIMARYLIELERVNETYDEVCAAAKKMLKDLKKSPNANDAVSEI